jgi:hypothetical protein
MDIIKMYRNKDIVYGVLDLIEASKPSVQINIVGSWQSISFSVRAHIHTVYCW